MRFISFVFRWALALGWMAFIFSLSAQSDPHVPGRGGSVGGIPLTKLGHLGEYGVLALLLVLALRFPKASSSRYGLALAFSTLYSISDELHQALVPERNPSFGDVLLDVAGAASALAAWWLLAVLRSRKAG